MPIIPQQNDVLFGKGSIINGHPGNASFRRVVDRRRGSFAAAKVRKQKRIIAKEVVGEIIKGGGRFLQEDAGAAAEGGDVLPEASRSSGGNDDIHPVILSKEWVGVDMEKVFTKVMHRLREKRLPGGKLEQPPSNGGCHQESEASAQHHQRGHPSPCGMLNLHQSEGAEDLEETPSILDDAESFGDIFDDIDSEDEVSNKQQGAVQYESARPDVMPAGSLDDLGGCLPAFDFPIPQETELCPSTSGASALPRADEKKAPKQLDDELTAFLRQFSAAHDTEPVEQQIEGTLQQWIQRSKSKHGANVLDYAKSCLPLAIKLTQCLLEAEKDEHSGQCNPIPLASIEAANVLVRAKEQVLNTPNGKRKTEAIEFVSIMSLLGDDADSGGALPRLAALGLILYELFAGEAPAVDVGSSPDGLSINSIRLSSGEHTHRTRNKSQRRQGMSISCLRLKHPGIPYSLCSLVDNLLDCNQGDSRGDEAYSTIADVLFDLQLLETNEKSLEDIKNEPFPYLVIPDRMYGREEETKKLEAAYQCHVNGTCSGVLISGKAGVGKSKLASYVRDLSSGHVIMTKFDQSQDVFPLATVGSLFNSYIDLFVRDASPALLNMVNEALENALGFQASLLLGCLPNLSKLMPSSSLTVGYASCVDSSRSTQFMFNELLRVLSSYSSHTCFLIDDLHWADPISLQLIGSIIANNDRRKSVFFACSYRDNEIDTNEQFKLWLTSLSSLSLATVKLDNISADGVNSLLSDTFCLPPRITRPLASAIYHKSGGGNLLFIRQLIGSLKDQGYIYVDLSCPKWAWDLDKILQTSISDDVMYFLIEGMQKLDYEQQRGLQVASCIGSSIKPSVANVLSDDLKINLSHILEQLCEKGYMNKDKLCDGSILCYSFAHDKLQESAYQLMTEDQQRESHMRLGLALCSHSLSTNTQNDELFFTSINQINKGGSDALTNPSQRAMIAKLNLKAGQRSLELSDVNTAAKLFKHGISFLNRNHWIEDYELSINLFDAVSDAASFINDGTTVLAHTEQLFANARRPDDKLNCLYAVTKSLSNTGLQRESVENSFKILSIFGEKEPTKPCPQLLADMKVMNEVILSTHEEAFMNIQVVKDKKLLTLMNVYRLLGHSFHFSEQALLASTSLRMMQISLDRGLCSVSPVAFAFYAEVAAHMGNLELGNRLGRIALKLVEKGDFLLRKSQVYAVVYSSNLWTSTPFQAVADSHLSGFKAGQISGDIVSSYINEGLSIVTKYVAGESLACLRKVCREKASAGLNMKIGYIFQLSLLHNQVCALTEGLHVLSSEYIDGVPGLQVLLNRSVEQKNAQFPIGCIAQKTVRTFLFRTFEDTSDVGVLLHNTCEKKLQLKPIFVLGLFFEGLVSFELARRATREDERREWLATGEFALGKMRQWNEYCPWNFENKMLLLGAERRSILGEPGEAEALYVRSIRSARAHKFKHEEAVACELAGAFFHGRASSSLSSGGGGGSPDYWSCYSKSLSLFEHSIKCHNEWGAIAVAKRVEGTVRERFGSDLTSLAGAIDRSSALSAAFSSSSEEVPSKKRQGEQRS